MKKQKRFEVKTKLIFTTYANDEKDAIKKLEDFFLRANTKLEVSEIGAFASVMTTIKKYTKVEELPF